MASDRWRLPLAGLFTVSGVAHFVRPGPFASIVPSLLGPPRPWVFVSGVLELACAAGLAGPRATRRRAAYASAGLLVAVFPANVYMAWLALRDPTAGHTYQALVMARLPLQVPLVLAALSVARGLRPLNRQSGSA